MPQTFACRPSPQLCPAPQVGRASLLYASQPLAGEGTLGSAFGTGFRGPMEGMLEMNTLAGTGSEVSVAEREESNDAAGMLLDNSMGGAAISQHDVLGSEHRGHVGSAITMAADAQLVSDGLIFEQVSVQICVPASPVPRAFLSPGHNIPSYHTGPRGLTSLWLRTLNPKLHVNPQTANHTTIVPAFVHSHPLP